MSKIVVGILAALLMSVSVHGQPASGDDAVKGELRQLMTELNAALVASDRAALERIYADAFLFVHALGTVVDKKRQVDMALSARSATGIPIPSFDGLQIFGDVAIYRRHETERFGTTIYVKRGGRWQVLQQQGTPLPATRANAAVPGDVLRKYAGRYVQDNGLIVIIAVEADALTLQVEGRQTFRLTADAENKFSLPAGGGQLTFGDAAGTVTYELVRGNGTIIKGTRQK